MSKTAILESEPVQYNLGKVGWTVIYKMSASCFLKDFKSVPNLVSKNNTDPSLQPAIKI